MLYHRKSLGVALYTALVDVDAAATYSQTPADLFPGMSSNGTDLTIPIASMADYGLLAAHCGASTGDVRQLSYCLAARTLDWYKSLGSTVRPVAMEASVRRTKGLSSGSFANVPQDKITLSYYLDWPDKVVASESS